MMVHGVRHVALPAAPLDDFLCHAGPSQPHTAPPWHFDSALVRGRSLVVPSIGDQVRFEGAKRRLFVRPQKLHFDPKKGPDPV